MSPPRIPRGRLHYAWIVAGVTFLTLLAAAAIRSTPAVLMIPVEREFHWSRAVVSLAVSVNLLCYGLFGPFAAALMDRIGLRRIMLISLAMVASGVALATLVREPWQLVLLWGVVVGLGTGTTAMVLGATVATRWFVERRGLVIGILTASTATGQLLFLPLLASVVVRFGWRAGILGVAGVAVVVLPIVAIFMRDDPREVGLRPFGADADEVGAARSGANPAAAALRAL
ncbi:MAG TPA: MFS transporter, partial [Candidatus Methylomirabilis sp.]|nr:MFS transporter [Candidatus Methylomirabilis sp.]